MQLIQSSFIFIISFYLSLRLGKYFNVNQLKIAFVFLLKTAICLIYIPIAENLDNDAYGYFINSLIREPDSSFVSTGTDFVFAITKFLRVNFNFDIISITLIFSFIGTIGTIIYLSNIQTFNQKTSKYIIFLSELFVYFPTVNIWITAIGKDAITFTAINLIIYSYFNIRKRILILIIACILFSLVRPFIGIVIFVSLTISLLAKVELPKFQKFFVRLSAIIGLIYVNSINKAWLKFENLRPEIINQAIDYYSVKTASGNNAIDLTSMPLPTKLFSFMYRPLFFDAYNLYSVLMSFENLVLIIITLYAIINIVNSPSSLKVNFNGLTLFLSTFLITSWTFYSLTMGNLGTANRYKLQILPALIILALLFSREKGSKIIEKSSSNNQIL